MPTRSNPPIAARETSAADDGFLLIGAIVMIALVMIALAIAAPRVARDLRRQKEVEAIHRGNQYVRGIQLYYRKFGRYPGSMDQIVQTNNIRFLRQKYTDPITGQDDFAIIPLGQNKTTVKTFFGEPLAGLPAAGLGSVAGMASPGIGIGAASSTSATTAASPAPGGAAPGATATGTAASGTTGASSTPPSAATPASSPFGASTSPFNSNGLSQPFMGVSLGAKGDSITELNGETDYGDWEFLYDPRLDQMKARAAGLNGAPGSIPGSSLGQPSIPTGLTGGPAAPTTLAPPTVPASPTPPNTPASPAPQP